jgi:hypothetical protein
LAKVGEKGYDAVEVATEFAREIAPRLRPGTIEGLREDLAKFSGKTELHTRVRQSLKAVTQDERAARAAAQELVMFLREALQRAEASKSVLKASGVGTNVPKGSVSKVLAAADQMLGAGEKHSDAFRDAGILPADLEKLRLLREAVQVADVAQGRERLTAVAQRVERDALAYRIQRAVEGIGMAGMIEFQGRPDVVARFRALMPVIRRANKKGKGAGDAGGGGT